MTFLFILIFGIALFLYGLKEYYQVKLGRKPQPTPEATIAYLAQLIEQSAETGNFLDLSSGYGSVVFGLASRLPTWEVTGVEQSPTPWIVSNLRSIGKNFGNYRFFLKDPTGWSLRNYNVIFLNQDQKVTRQWEAGIARRLQPGTLFISYNSPLPRVKPIDTLTVSPTTKLYIYQKPIPTEVAPPPLPIEPVDNTVPPQPAPVPPLTPQEVQQAQEEIQQEPELPLENRPA